ncbi:hypothetical protein LTR95_001747, partial [Oleoguttula sp. CCFEE 5521]
VCRITVREYENGFRRRTEEESVLPRAPAEVTNFVNQFVRGRSEAFKQVLRKTNVDIAEHNKLQGGEDGYYLHPGLNADVVYDMGYRHKHQDTNQCEKCRQCTEWHDEVCEVALRASCGELGCQPCRSNDVRASKIHFGRYASGNTVMKSGHQRDQLIQQESVIGFEMEGAGAWEVFGTIVVKGVVDCADSHKNKRWRGYPAARAALCAAALIEEVELPDRPRAVNVVPTTADQSEQLWLIPRSASQQHVGYEHVLERLAGGFLTGKEAPAAEKQIVFVLSGIGGVGKSETVLQFLEKHDQALRQRLWAVFWVDCGGEASIRTAFKTIGSRCGWPLDEDGKLFGARDQLVSCGRPLLLILDNCDEAKMDHGALYSCRRTDPQHKKEKLFVRMEGLEREAAVDLLLEGSTSGKYDGRLRAEASKLVNVLDCHPLATIVASSLLRDAIYSLTELLSAL